MTCPRCWGSKLERATGGTCGYCFGAGVKDDQQLSPHFWLSEFLRSDAAVRNGLANDPTTEIVLRLQSFAQQVLEPLRGVVGPIKVTSGYRSPAVNAKIGGAGDSAHTFADESCASDLESGLSPPTRVQDFFRQVQAAMKRLSLPFDQIIFEFGVWAHVGWFGPNSEQRGEVEQVFSAGQYTMYDPTDPRCV